jgi:hypothetical protein
MQMIFFFIFLFYTSFVSAQNEVKFEKPIEKDGIDLIMELSNDLPTQSIDHVKKTYLAKNYPKIMHIEFLFDVMYFRSKEQVASSLYLLKKTQSAFLKEKNQYSSTYENIFDLYLKYIFFLNETYIDDSEQIKIQYDQIKKHTHYQFLKSDQQEQINHFYVTTILKTKDTQRIALFKEENQNSVSTAMRLLMILLSEPEIQDQNQLIAQYQALVDETYHQEKVTNASFLMAALHQNGDLKQAQSILERYLIAKVTPEAASNPYFYMTLFALEKFELSNALQALQFLADWQQKKKKLLQVEFHKENELVRSWFLIANAMPLEAWYILEKLRDQPLRSGFRFRTKVQWKISVLISSIIALEQSLTLNQSSKHWSIFESAYYHIQLWLLRRDLLAHWFELKLKPVHAIHLFDLFNFPIFLWPMFIDEIGIEELKWLNQHYHIKSKTLAQIFDKLLSQTAQNDENLNDFVTFQRLLQSRNDCDFAQKYRTYLSSKCPMLIQLDQVEVPKQFSWLKDEMKNSTLLKDQNGGLRVQLAIEGQSLKMMLFRKDQLSKSEIISSEWQKSSEEQIRLSFWAKLLRNQALSEVEENKIKGLVPILKKENNDLYDLYMK